MKRIKTLLRNNAAMAKARLVTGFWNETHELQSLKNLNNQNMEDEQLYIRVVYLLESGEKNPLAKLLDRNYMSKLDDASRQRYVLEMSNIVNRNISRYNSQRIERAG